jgi:tetratricopeptide (TPR) repeat protein
MTSRAYATGLVILVLSNVVPASAAADDALGDAKRLYAAASYDEALSVLSEMGETAAGGAEVEQYRALCLLALNRQREAEATLEQLAIKQPLLTFENSDVSPKLVALYGAIRKRTLPGSARTLYEAAKANFERGDFTAASNQFKDVVALASTAQESADRAVLGDLKMLALGFLTLTEQRLAKPVVEQAPPPVAPTPQPAPPQSAPPPIYNAADEGIIPPAPVRQRMPDWQPPPHFAGRTFQGILEVIIDENGAVEKATLTTSVNVVYDLALLNAAKRWKYTPALKDGQPVKCRKLIAVVVH